MDCRPHSKGNLGLKAMASPLLGILVGCQRLTWVSAQLCSWLAVWTWARNFHFIFIKSECWVHWNTPFWSLPTWCVFVNLQSADGMEFTQVSNPYSAIFKSQIQKALETRYFLNFLAAKPSLNWHEAINSLYTSHWGWIFIHFATGILMALFTGYWARLHWEWSRTHRIGTVLLF